MVWGSRGCSLRQRHVAWRIILGLTVFGLLYNVGSIIHLLNLSPQAAAALSFSRNLQIVIGVTWGAVFTYCTIMLVSGRLAAEDRVIWALYGFIVYSAARLLLFSQADYDRARLPFVLVGAAGLLAVLTVVWWGLRSSRRYAEDKENLSDDG